VSVTVTPNDGKVDGGQSSASAIVRPNQPPTPDAGPGGTAAEGSAYTGTGTYIDPDGDAVVSGTVDYGDGSPVQALSLSAGTFALNHVYRENGSYTVTVRVTDDGGATGSATAVVTVTNVAPEIGPNLNPAAPVPVGTATTITATFTDAGALDTHTATVDWGDGTTSAATVNQAARTLTASHVYALTGTYTIGVTVTDDDGGAVTVSPYDYGVVFDASGAYVSASGFFTSPPGAWPAQPSSNAKAEFGLSAKPGSTALAPPTGKFRFTYDINPLDHGCMAATCLELDSTAYTSLTIVNAKATVKGAGTLNGKTGYKFVVSVIDGSPDRVRVRIVDALSRVVYDSQPGAAETADPTTPLTGGSVLVKK
jgi:PKD repeat protein